MVFKYHHTYFYYGIIIVDITVHHCGNCGSDSRNSRYSQFLLFIRLIEETVPLFYKYLNRQLVVAIIFIVLAITCAVIPLLPNLWLLYVCAFMGGVCSSVISCAYTVWMIEMWKSKSGNVLQIAEFGFGIGSILAPVIMKPYLVGEVGTGTANSDSFYSSHVNEHHMFVRDVAHVSEDVSDIDRRGRLMWPTLITGACILPGERNQTYFSHNLINSVAVPIASIVMYFIRPYKPPTEKSELSDNNNASIEEVKLFDRPDTPRKSIRILCALWYSFYVIFETVFLKFAVTYFQYCPLQLKAQKAAELFSICTAVFTAVRGLNVFVALKVKMIYMIYYNYAILMVGMVLLAFGVDTT